ncbi:hypothetical protein Bca52824_064695 [Brassica carinata]|uniref:RNA helicase n=1 Tax=Brassica carinata TaxID=52824 RepID=A0A8X7QH04_BRACI|nr:hypothetical protein Bca52824_064695 [Brassica carinata]
MRRILSSKRPKGSIKPIASFDGMGMNNKVLRGVKKPSEIQQRAVLPILKGRDVIAQAQSGTGKTSMIAISVCQIGNTSSRKIQVLVLSPQTEKTIHAIGVHTNIKAYACIGLEHGVHAVSGTPGRVVYDMIKRGSLQTKSVKLLILDESDEMLSKGLKYQIYDVYRSGIKQYYVDVGEEEWKFDTLCDIFMGGLLSIKLLSSATQDKKYARVDWLNEKMRSSNFIVSSMHGDKRQKERGEIMNQFRSFKSRPALRVLIASDVWAQGIDVQTVSHVINYDIPNNPELYIHRVAINFVKNSDMKTLCDIERYYGTRIREMPADLA